MSSLTRLIAVLALVVGFAATARAHSLGEVEATLGDKEKYSQAFDKFAPDLTLRTADGAVMRLADLRGKVVVLHFIYTSCPDVCPVHAERLVNGTPMKDLVSFVTVTTDPSNDTSEVMREYGPAHGLDPVNWMFLTTTPEEPEDATRKLAESYGHKFVKTEDGYQMHGIVTHVIDRDGIWKANFHGLQFDPVNFVTFVNALTNDTSRPHGHEQKSWWAGFGVGIDDARRG